MKKRNGISLIISIMIIFPSITATGAVSFNFEKNNLLINPLEDDLCPVHPINVTKTVWNSDISDWVDYYEAELSEIVHFNITITYNKNCLFGYSAEQIQVNDTLPSGLEYEGSENYNETYINGSQIFWNLSGDHGIILHDKESVSILFEAIVSEYGIHENYVEVYAFETGCNWDLYGDSDATVYGVPPDPSFEKKVKDPESGEWVEETFQYVNETVTFKIELTYFGVYNLKNVSIVDYLPEVTEYGNQASIEPSFVSKDRTIVWWNLSEIVENDDPLIITFDADVWGRTGDCPYCGINLAEYTAIEYVTQKNHQGEDTAAIISDNYKDPKLAYYPSNIDFGKQEPGYTGSNTFEIWNDEEQSIPLIYEISENIDWIEVSPTSGSSEGEPDEITVSVGDTINMSGFYGESIDITSNGGSGSVFISIFIQEEEPIEPGLKVTIKRGLSRSIKVNIENTGNVDINNITWNITVNRRGFIKKELLDKNDTITILKEGTMETVKERPRGIGFITVTVNVNADGLEPFEKTVKGFIILRFIRLRRFL
jgi:hypothetical protein